MEAAACGAAAMPAPRTLKRALDEVRPRSGIANTPDSAAARLESSQGSLSSLLRWHPSQPAAGAQQQLLITGAPLLHQQPAHPLRQQQQQQQQQGGLQPAPKRARIVEPGGEQHAAPAAPPVQQLTLQNLLERAAMESPTAARVDTLQVLLRSNQMRQSELRLRRLSAEEALAGLPPLGAAPAAPPAWAAAPYYAPPAAARPSESCGSSGGREGLAEAAVPGPVNPQAQEVDQPPPERTSLATMAQLALCPLSRAPMRDPVVAADGFTYDRSSLQPWLRRSQLSPITGQPLPSLELRPNRLVRAFTTLLRGSRAAQPGSLLATGLRGA